MTAVSAAAKENKKEGLRKWRAKNAEYVRQKRREYDAKNLEKKKQYDKAYCLKNAEKMNRAAKEWQKNNPEAVFRIKLKHKYGITPDEVRAMLEKQNHVCAICGTTNFNNRGRCLEVDHCHTTGRVRGMLCSGCNAAIGLMKDNPISLRAAAMYLEGTC